MVKSSVMSKPQGISGDGENEPHVAAGSRLLLRVNSTVDNGIN